MNDESYMDSDEIEEMPDESGSDILEILDGMRRQLTFLEKKVDLLLSRAEGERPVDRARPSHGTFRKPPRDKPFQQRFDRPPRRDRNEGEGGERGYRDRESSRDQYFDRRSNKAGKKPGGKPRSGFGKKPFYSRYKD